MSQTVVVKLRIDQTVDASDRVVHRLDLREILPAETMAELLVDALESRGFEREDETTLVREKDDGERQTVDLESMEVISELELERVLDGEVDARIDVDFDRRSQEDAAREQMTKNEREALRKEATRQLMESESERRQELDSVIEEVYAEALKQKARSLGNVVSQHESRDENGEYELVIKVEV